MPQSLSKVLVHLVFSTKLREPCIHREIRSRLHAYLVGILGDLKCPSLQTGGMLDHVHLLFAQSRTMALSDIVEEIKTSSSRWMKVEGVRKFQWQAGYGAFSIGESQAPRVIEYIQDQEQHHRKMTF